MKNVKIRKNPLNAGLVRSFFIELVRFTKSSTKTSFRKRRPEYSDYLGLILCCKFSFSY